jgi:hypothetical protein
MEESVAVSPTQYANLSITIAPKSSTLLTGPRSYQGLKGETGEPLLHPRRSCVDILNNYSHGLLVDRSFGRAYLSKPERCIPNAFDVTCAESLQQKCCIATCIGDCRVWRVRDKGAAARHQPVRAASIHVRFRSRHAHQERYAQHHHRTHKTPPIIPVAATYTIQEFVQTSDLMNEAQPGEPVQPLLVMVTGFGVGVVAAGAGGGLHCTAGAGHWFDVS